MPVSRDKKHALSYSRRDKSMKITNIRKNGEGAIILDSVLLVNEFPSIMK